MCGYRVKKSLILLSAKGDYSEKYNFICYGLPLFNFKAFIIEMKPTFESVMKTPAIQSTIQSERLDFRL